MPKNVIESKSKMWNLWHGCHKLSAGCKHCYAYQGDLRFMIITKRIDRLQVSMTDDWGDGYDNVTICCTIESQNRVDYRLPIYKEALIKHKILICKPLLEHINLSSYNIGSWVEQLDNGVAYLCV